MQSVPKLKLSRRAAHLLMGVHHSLRPCACATSCSRLLRPLPLGPHSSTAPPGTDRHLSRAAMRSKACKPTTQCEIGTNGLHACRHSDCCKVWYCNHDGMLIWKNLEASMLCMWAGCVPTKTLRTHYQNLPTEVALQNPLMPRILNLPEAP